MAVLAPQPRLEADPRVAVAAEDQLTRRRLAAALDLGGLPPVVTAADQAELEACARGCEVLVLACDVSQPGSLSGLRRLRRSARDSRLVLVIPSPTGPTLRRALDAGADGVVAESELEAALSASVRAVSVGQAAVPRRLRASVDKPAFSHREKQVLALVAAGLANSEIADRLFLSESTIKSHLSSSFAKLGVRSRKEAAALVLDPDEGIHVQLATAAEGAVEAP
jgi:DNA-binding NarL/FixJ family response regulator